MLINGFNWRALWSYLIGTNQPPRDQIAEHGTLQHMHRDRSSGHWVEHEEASEETAA